uniref:Ribosomal protein L3 n=2 Tax=Amorphochlora amoebiformis TaxID=1561963 RepID=A0A0H5BHZ8_9EUKA|nr:ribosomal protein L3 [Amorphochlora amoebiformis]
MSHRKFEHPRLGSLGYIPKKRANKLVQNIKIMRSYNKYEVFPKIIQFFGYKVGMTHVMRTSMVSNSRVFHKEVCDSVSIIECPPVLVIGVNLYSLISGKYKKSYHFNIIKNSRKRSKTSKEQLKNLMINSNFLNQIISYYNIIKISVRTYYRKNSIENKKPINLEFQILGGSPKAKIEYAFKLLGKKIFLSSLFKQDENVDILGITKGHGTQGVIRRWGVTRLPRKTRRGFRKVGCIGPWNPSRVSWTIARGGQMGYHKRKKLNNKILKVGNSNGYSKNSTTLYDLSVKSVNCLGGYKKYGFVHHDFLMIKGSIPGCQRRPLIISASKGKRSSKFDEVSNVTFIDTSSKIGHGRFQTTSEKALSQGKNNYLI